MAPSITKVIARALSPVRAPTDSSLGISDAAALAEWGVPRRRPVAFNRAQEFPNPLLPPRLTLAARPVSAAAAPGWAVKQGEQLLNASLQAVVARLAAPFRKDGKVAMKAFVPELLRKLEKVDSNAHVTVEGEGLQRLLSYVHHELHEGMLRGTPPVETLRSELLSKGPLYAVDVLGPNEPVTFRVIPSSESRRAAVEAVVGQVDKRYRASFKHEPAGGAQVAVLHTAVGASPRREVSTSTDALVYDVKQGQLGTLRGHSAALNDFIAGHVTFTPPPVTASPLVQLRALADGLQTLVALPFLELRNPDDFAAIARRCAQALPVKTAKELGARYPEGEHQPLADRLRRAGFMSRYGGANNRFRRGGPDSVERAAWQAFSRPDFADLSLKLFPRFLENYPSNRVSGALAREGLPEPFLVSRDEYIRDYTHGGGLFHGTDSFADAVRLDRYGCFVDPNGDRGSGHNVAPRKAEARHYAHREEMLLRYPVTDPDPTIVARWGTETRDVPEDVRKAFFDQMAEEIAVDANHPNRSDVLEGHLAFKYGVGVFVTRRPSHHQIVQSQNLLDMRVDPRLVALARLQAMKHASEDPERAGRALANYLRARPWAVSVGVRGLPPARKLFARVFRSLSNEEPNNTFFSKYRLLKQWSGQGLSIPRNALRMLADLIHEARVDKMEQCYGLYREQLARLKPEERASLPQLESFAGDLRRAARLGHAVAEYGELANLEDLETLALEVARMQPNAARTLRQLEISAHQRGHKLSPASKAQLREHWAAKLPENDWAPFALSRAIGDYLDHVRENLGDPLQPEPRLHTAFLGFDQLLERGSSFTGIDGRKTAQEYYEEAQRLGLLDPTWERPRWLDGA